MKKKKWVFWLVILMLLGYEAVHKEAEITGNDLTDRRSKVITAAPGRTDITVVSIKQIYQGNLLLVNKKYPVHKSGVTKDIVNLHEYPELVQGYGLLDNTIMLSQSVVQRFSEMIEAAAADDVANFLISSGYRDTEEQKRLYEEKGAEYALPPGHSEHNLGLSLDIGSTQTAMNNAPEGKWLQKNAWKYGFILRYPSDKTGITGIQYEPWHFRYVGLPHSRIMQDKNFTLEEYLEFLKEQQSYSAMVEGKQYEVSYHSVTGNTPIPIPADRRFELSGNNMDGVILTVFP